MKGAFGGFILVLSLLQFVYSCSKDASVLEEQAPTQYTLTVTTSEGGFVTPDANGTYDAGAQLTLSAIPNEGYTFCRWLGTDNDNLLCKKSELQGARGKSHCIILMNSNRNVEAFFEEKSE